jgi:hypothetical protein
MDTLNKSQLIVLKKLRDDCGTENLSADCAATIAAMDKRYSLSSTRVALTALKKAYPECAAFAAETTKRRSGYRALDEAQEPTERQAEKFVSWENIQDFREMYKAEMTNEEYLVLCLYSMWAPVRADYTPMMIVSRKPRVCADGMNYLIVRPKSIDVLLHCYKTHGVYGDVQRQMPKPLEAIVRQYIIEHPGQTYLLEDNGKPWSEQRLGATLRRPFQRIHKIDTGISSFRHSYATHMYAGMPALKDLRKISESMLHSVTTSQAYRHINME